MATVVSHADRAPRSTGQAKRRGAPRSRQQIWLAYLLLAPGLLLIVTLILIPVIQTVRYSFYRWDGYAPDMPFVGLRMYQQAIAGLGFLQAVRNSLIWGLVALIAPPLIGLVAAAIVEDSRLQPKWLFRFGFFLPYFFSMAVAGAIFTRVYDPSYGLLNRILGVAGSPNAPQWLGDQNLALAAAIAVFVWHETAFCFIVFAAAIQQIDRDLYDAARVDGAGPVQVFRDVTIPGLRTIATFVMTIMLIGGLTPFAVVFALTNPGLGGPYYATEVFPTLIFKKGLQGTNLGQASALPVMLLVVVVSIAVGFSLARERQERAEGLV